MWIEVLQDFYLWGQVQRRESASFWNSLRANKVNPTLRKSQQLLFSYCPEKIGRAGKDNTLSMEQHFEEVICFKALSSHKSALNLTTWLC